MKKTIQAIAALFIVIIIISYTIERKREKKETEHVLIFNGE
jgi:hypothetical protein